ncbi:MAG: exodeoxyribonuclease VII large subunit [Micavibrio aeruginosavorus]|uniref:Exodeoxyribonuclease 7 large subunit n=1 Tax=Micavibrio aeruginosavorus TaxID=349221 RepID=A0A2W5HK01_9BACT|nr:MAG: exodeoxyribonuclease VII large subunit [Micavibrio aeruginosavorus]
MSLNSNVPELSVSELSFSLKKTLEDSFGRVRVRGELSKVKIHTSGHMYSDLKDADCLINVVCWKATVARLSVRPEEGLEVIVTGRVTTYPSRSNYQLVVENIELAGEGALLKMLEDRRKRLATEGLFEESRKQKLPYLPGVIGVVTSPTGAVIRDILHRLEDRFPRRVLVWPVKVQGAGAAEEIAAAIKGFAALPIDGPIPRPDLIIVARGGGSLEDLMPFNEEIVVRAASDCPIPLISAVGHETDTTLIDYVSDRRAPTPTAAAEMAVPERLGILGWLQENQHRLISTMSRSIKSHRQDLAAQAAHLKDPKRLLELKIQALDRISDKLSHSLERQVSSRNQFLQQISSRLPHPRQTLEQASQNLSFQRRNLDRLGAKLLEHPQRQLAQTGQMLEVLSFRNILKRGYAVIRSPEGHLISSAKTAQSHNDLSLEFADGKIQAHIKKA